MSLIEEDEKALRLARAIMADIWMYNAEKLKHALDPEHDLAKEVEEGRQLFQARVAPRLYMIFEDAVHKWAAEVRGRATPGAPTPERAQRVEAAVMDQDRRRAEAIESIKRTRMAMTLVFVLIAIAGAAFYFVSHEHSHEAPGKHEGRR